MRTPSIVGAVVLNLALLAQVPPSQTPETPERSYPGLRSPQIQKLLQRIDGGLAQTDEELAMETAKLFFAGVAQRKANYVMGSLASSGFIEERFFANEAEYQEAWLRAIQQGAGTFERVNGISILTLAEMEKRYGKPPARLRLPRAKPAELRIAVANLSGRPAVAVLQRLEVDVWRVTGYTD